MTIKEYDLVKVNVSDLTFDSQNPNQMSKEQMHGLKKSMDKYGFLVPIIIDNKNRLVDGAHRAAIYKANNIEEIPAFRISLDSEIDSKQLRQVLNKLKGTHDLNKDVNEFEFLNHEGRLGELAELLGQNENSLAIFLSRHEGIDLSSQQSTENKQANNESQPEEFSDEATELDNDDINSDSKCPRCGYEW